MIKALGTTLLVAAAFAFGADAEAQTTPSHHGKTVHHARPHHRGAKARTACKRARRHTHYRHRHRHCTAHKAKHRKLHRSRARRPHARPAADRSGLSVTSTTPYSANLRWNSVAGAATARVWVNSHMIDDIAAGGSASYDIPGLWPATDFRVQVVIRNGAGQIVAQHSRIVTTAARSGSFPRLYSPNTFINTPVGQSPSLEPNSGAIVSQAFQGYSSRANLSNDTSWGIPVYHASPQSTSYNVACQYYDCWHQFGPVNIPSNAQPQSGGDGHLVVLQPGGQEFDMWIGQHTASGWTAGSRWEESAYGSAANCTRVHGCGAADVAGFALAAGMVRPEEIAQGHIDHALAITTPDTRANYIACPATDTDGHHDDPSALPVGAHVQLDPNINVAALRIPAWEKVIAVALQQYGAYVIDTGGSVAVYAESNLDRTYNAWGRAGVPADSPSLANLPWGSMRVLSMTQCG
ncbi:MAG TPA: hypothetical protein VGH45_03625 [Solirubrobacteraceae bacterium]